MMRVCLLLMLPWMLGLAPAQELSEEVKGFLANYRGLIETEDLRGIERLVGRQERIAEASFNELCFQYYRAPKDQLPAETRMLAEALDEKQNAKRFVTRCQYLEGLNDDQLAGQLEAYTLLVPAVAGVDKALASREAADWRLGLNAVTDAMDLAKKLDNKELTSYLGYLLGRCHENTGDYLACVKSFDIAMDDWLKAERPKDAFYNYMTQRRRELIQKGYDPESEGGPGAGPVAKNTATSYVEGSDWIDCVTEQKQMKSPDFYTTPSPLNTGRPILWRQFQFDKNGNQLGLINPFKPFGAPVKVFLDGSKGMLDLDGDNQADLEAKIIAGKPNVVRIAESKDRDANWRALFLMTIGQSQLLGQQVNYSNRGAYRVASYRTGTLLGQPFVLLDDNCSGSFGDPEERRDGTLRGNPNWIDNDAMVLGKGKKAIPFSEFVQVDDKWHRIKLVDTEASAIRTRELDLESGQVKLEWDGPVKPTSLVIAEQRELIGAFFDISGKNPVTVPVGRYEIAYGKLEKGSRANMEHAWIFPGKSKEFEVKAGETTVLEMGGPYTFDFQVKDAGKEFTVVGRSLLIHDRAGAIVGKLFAKKPLLPNASVQVQGGGAKLAKAKGTRLVDQALFNKDNEAIWFPQDFTVEKAAGAKCEAMLDLKKHAFLGGPFSSEWIQ